MAKVIYKPVGISPLDAIKSAQNKGELPSEKLVKISYAGRLDPLAEGALLVLIGEENKRRRIYLGLDKVYEVDILFGLKTDTYDILGIPEEIIDKKPLESEIRKTLREFVGQINQSFPPYSSKTVKGKPLYWWARAGRLNEIKIPVAKREIYQIEVLEVGFVNAKELYSKIIGKLKSIEGDFRQPEIKKAWNDLLGNCKGDFATCRLRVSCSSGTYMRGLANDMGNALGSGATVFGIMRESIGTYSLKRD